MRQKMEDTSTSLILPTSDFLICHTGDTSRLKPAHITTLNCLYEFIMSSSFKNRILRGAFRNT